MLNTEKYSKHPHKRNWIFTLASEFLNKIHYLYQGKRYRLPQKGHFFRIFEVSGFILAKIFSLKGNFHGISLFSSHDY